jgi:hypothetical protein
VQELSVEVDGVKNLARASYCSTNGDSGAPIFSYNVGYGIHHGSDKKCTTWYQGLRWAEEKMNVSTLTYRP